MRKQYLSLVLILFSCSLSKNEVQNIGKVKQGNDPNFKIVSHSDPGFTSTNRKVLVFGIPIYAYAQVEDEKLLHAANIMAQYLDNDENGVVDNEILLKALKANNAALFMWKNESEININAQDLGANETSIRWHKNGHQGQFDAALEEIWHVISHSGYSKAYPGIFGEKKGSEIAKAMDKARGGHFESIPKPYPPNAWYHYDDSSCNYECMVAEYFYWGITTMLGAQENRAGEIKNEWKLFSKKLFKEKDVLLYKLLTNTKYKFPKKLPDGTYKR